MSSPPRPNPSGDDGSREAIMAKAAAVLVFSGIALSVVKSLVPKFHHKPPGSQPLPRSQPPPSAGNEPDSLPRTLRIEKGDTLWGLSRRYGVSVGALKEANGLTGDTIYAGRRLVIPSS